MSSNPITLREYLEQYSKARRSSANSPGQDCEHDGLKFLEQNIAAIKAIISGKVNSAAHNSVLAHLDNIKDLFKLSFNKRANLNESTINIRCTQTRSRLKTIKTMKCSLRRQESLPEISLGIINEAKSLLSSEETPNLESLKSSATSFARKPLQEVRNISANLQLQDTILEKREEKQRKICFNLPPRLERKMYTEIDESHPGKENRNHVNMAD